MLVRYPEGYGTLYMFYRRKQKPRASIFFVVSAVGDYIREGLLFEIELYLFTGDYSTSVRIVPTSTPRHVFSFFSTRVALHVLVYVFAVCAICSSQCQGCQSALPNAKVVFNACNDCVVCS